MARLIKQPIALSGTLLFLLGSLLVGIPSNAAHAAAPSAPLQIISISMGYIPNVQFAPFYVADARGYYRSVGLHINFNYAQAPNIMQQIGSGNLDFGVAEGDQVLAGRAQGLPLVTVFTQYQRFPVVIFSLHSSGIHRFTDLRGKNVGIPGFYGASYTGLLAALNAAHLTTHDLHLTAIGYTQAQQVAQHKVDAAVGFGMNEPVLLRQQGYTVDVLPISTLAPLVGPGIVTSEKIISSQSDLVRRFVQATYRAQKETNADPVGAFAIARRYMPSIAADQAPFQLAVLRAAIGYWTPPAGRGLGCSSPSDWSSTAAILLAQKQIKTALNSKAAFTNQFVSGC